MIRTTPIPLEEMISLTPKTLLTIAPNQDYELTINITQLPEFQKRTSAGTISLTSGINSQTYGSPLPIAIRTSWNSYSNSELGLTFTYPSDYQVTTRESKQGTEVVIIDPSSQSPDLAVTLAMQVFDTTPANPTIQDVIKLRLNPQGLLSEAPLLSGELVEADTLLHWYFFGYSPASHRGLQIYGPTRDYFLSNQFAAWMSTLKF